MPRTVGGAFDLFSSWLVPSSAEVSAAAGHRESVLAALRNQMTVREFFQSGSFSHGTAVSGYSDVDYFAVLGYDKPDVSDTALEWVRTRMALRYPSTQVRVDRPAVVVPFAAGAETYEVIPAFALAAPGAALGYSIPAPNGAGWVHSNPRVHLAYVNRQNDRLHKAVKPLVRLVKAWAYYNTVPISSFYLEMRTSAYAATQSLIVPDIDVAALLRIMSLEKLAAFPDPTGVAGAIEATASTFDGFVASTAVSRASVSADRAMAHRDTDPRTALAHWDEVYAGKFPAYY